MTTIKVGVIDSISQRRMRPRDIVDSGNPPSAYHLLLSLRPHGRNCRAGLLGGVQHLSASVSWAPTGGGHIARQPLPSPSHLESTHETHAARRGLAAGRGRCEKRTSHAPFAHA